MTKYDHNIHLTFHALADPTRSSVIERLALGSAATTELASGFALALPTFLKHLSVLEQAGLVRSQKVGRTRTWTLEPSRLNDAQRWLSQQKQVWEQRLDRLDAFLTAQDTDE